MIKGLVMNSRQKRLVIYIGAPLVSFLFWLWVFSTINDPSDGTGRQRDTLSGQDYNKTAVDSDRGPNRNAPYFVGFNLLLKYGIPASDLTYIRDVITNDTLYRKKVLYAKISYVDGSIKAPQNNGLKTSYSFQYGINGSDQQTANVISDLEDSSISIELVEGTTIAFKKKFTVYL